MRPLALAVLALLACPGSVLAHCSWRDNAYNYLDLADRPSGSHPPASVTQRVHAVRGRVPALTLATSDGQAQIIAPSGTFSGAVDGAAVRVQIAPVPVPPALSSAVRPSGNAYRITVGPRQVSRALRISAPFGLYLKVVHRPTGITGYWRGAWHQICEATARNVIEDRVIFCQARHLGTFLVTSSWTCATGPNTPLTWLNPYIPLLSVVGVIVLTIVLSYLVWRQDQSPHPA